MASRVDVFGDGFFLGGRPGSTRPRSSAKKSTMMSETRAAYGPKPIEPVTRKAKLAGRRTGGTYDTVMLSRPGTAPARLERDFTKINKEALRKGLVTSKEQQRFRELHTGYVARPTRGKGRLDRNHNLPDEGHVYGAKSMPPEQLSDILAHQHGRDWLETRHAELKKTRARSATVAGPAASDRQPTTTRTVMLRRKLAARTEVDEAPWQLRQFQDVAPRVSTFRDPDTLRKAAQNHRRSLPTHYGSKFGHGVARNPAGTSRNL